MLPSIVADRDELRRRQEAHAAQLASAAALLRQQRLLKTIAGTPALQPRSTGIIPPTPLEPLVPPAAPTPSKAACKGAPAANRMVHTNEDTGLVLVGAHAPLLAYYPPAASTAAILDADEAAAASWNVRSGTFCGISKLKVLCYAHLSAAMLHLAFFATTLIVGADSADPFIRVHRQQLLFTRLNTSSCSLADLNSTETDLVVVGVDNGMPVRDSTTLYTHSCQPCSTPPPPTNQTFPAGCGRIDGNVLRAGAWR